MKTQLNCIITWLPLHLLSTLTTVWNLVRKQTSETVIKVFKKFSFSKRRKMSSTRIHAYIHTYLQVFVILLCILTSIFQCYFKVLLTPVLDEHKYDYIFLGPSCVDLLGLHRARLSSSISRAHSQHAIGCHLALPLLPPLLLYHFDMISMQNSRLYLLRGLG